MNREETAAGFVEHASTHSGADKLSTEAWQELRADADRLGFFGLLGAAACSEPAEPDPEVREELPRALARDLADALGEPAADADLRALMRRFSEAKGERGPELLKRTIARVAYEVYDLAGHQFVQDDALAACELMAWGGAGQDAREMARRVARVSRRAARVVLGHLEGQLDLVHRLGDPEAPVTEDEIDGRLYEFAPRLFAQRLPSLAKHLAMEEKRFRFGFVLWARLRGLVIGRSGLTDVAQRIVPERPVALIEALEERRPARAAFRRAAEAWPQADWIEAALRA